jgi:prolipoprotein diacylglyceryltransferase
MEFRKANKESLKLSGNYNFFIIILTALLIQSIGRYNSEILHLMSFYIMGYNLFRFFIEYFREPDKYIGLTEFLQLSRGQILCLVFFVVGLGIMLWRIYLEKRPGQSYLK